MGSIKNMLAPVAKSVYGEPAMARANGSLSMDLKNGSENGLGERWKASHAQTSPLTLIFSFVKSGLVRLQQ